MKTNHKIALIVINALLLLTLFFYFSGYRLTAQQAAKASPFIEEDVQLTGEVQYDRIHVFLYKTEKNPVTILTVKQGFLWRNVVSSRQHDFPDPVRTVGWMSYSINDSKEGATVLGVVSDDPGVKYIEVEHPREGIKKEIETGEVLIFEWPERYTYDDLKPITALSDKGEILYEYRYPRDTGVHKSEEFKWYPSDN